MQKAVELFQRFQSFLLIKMLINLKCFRGKLFCYKMRLRLISELCDNAKQSENVFVCSRSCSKYRVECIHKKVQIN